MKIKIIFVLLFWCFAFSNNIFAEDADFVNTDTVNSESNDTTYKAEDTIAYLPLSEFMYADTRRYILSGGLPQVETKIKPIPAAIFGTGLATAFVLQHQLQMKTI